MKNLGIQLWTIRDCLNTEEEIKTSFAELAKYGYNEIETAGFKIDPLRMNELAREAGLTIISTHYEIGKTLNETDATIELHKQFGAKFVGCGGYGAAWASPEALKAFADRINEVGKQLSASGLKFIYHNHSTEFMRFEGDDRAKYFRFMDMIDPRYCSLEVDTYWVQHGGADVCATIRKLAGGKIDVLHCKDMAAHAHADGQNPLMTECGNGNINFTDIIPLAESLGVEHFIVEQDTNWKASPLDSARRSAEYLLANFR